MAERSVCACNDDPRDSRIVELYASGLSRAIAGLLSHIADDGHIVVISPAVPDPIAWPHRGIYGYAKDLQDATIYAMREDRENIGARGIHVHRIAPWAVAGSLYYEGTPEGLMPQRMIAVSEIVDVVKQALEMPNGYMDTDFFARTPNE